MKHITITDIAKRLNLSVSTISRALNDKYDIRQDTRELVLKTAKEMGYSPNPVARNLLERCSHLIGVIIPEFINAFFPEVIIGIQEVLKRENYQLLIMQSNEDPSIEMDNIKTLECNMVDGIIISLTKETKDVTYLNKLIEEGFPVVLFNRTSKLLKASSVVLDDYRCAFFATEHLIHQGYKNIIHLMGPRHVNLSLNRRDGFIDALRKHKMEIRPDQVIECGFLIQDGENAAESIIKMGVLPDAILAANDPSAIGAIKVFKKHGIKIPDDIGIVGFTESPMATILDPPLTSVAQPTLEIGKTAARLILEQLKSKGSFIPQTIVLNGTLNIRESSTRRT